jgi:hypothetical protein
MREARKLASDTALPLSFTQKQNTNATKKGD